MARSWLEICPILYFALLIGLHAVPIVGAKGSSHVLAAGVAAAVLDFVITAWLLARRRLWSELVEVTEHWSSGLLTIVYIVPVLLVTHLGAVVRALGGRDSCPQREAGERTVGRQPDPRQGLFALSPPPMMGPGGLPIGTSLVRPSTPRGSPAVVLVLAALTTGLGLYVWQAADRVFDARGEGPSPTVAATPRRPSAAAAPGKSVAVAKGPQATGSVAARPTSPGGTPTARTTPAGGTGDFEKQKGVELIYRGEYREAIPVLQGVRARRPNDADVRYYLFLAYKNTETGPSRSLAYAEARQVVRLAPRTRQASDARAYIERVEGVPARPRPASAHTPASAYRYPYPYPQYTPSDPYARYTPSYSYRRPAPPTVNPNSPSVVTPYGSSGPRVYRPRSSYTPGYPRTRVSTPYVPTRVYTPQAPVPYNPAPRVPAPYVPVPR